MLIVNGGNERILLIDDEPAIVDVATSMLIDLGYTVDGRTDAIQALDYTQNHACPYDLVITDYSMQQMNGIEVIQRLRRIKPDITAILSTGYQRDLKSDETKELGIDALLLKPYERRQLATTIRQLLDKQKPAVV